MSYKTEYNLTDYHLVDKVLSGDTKAFEVIIKKTEGLVAQIVLKMISNTDERKDIAQDIYLKTFNKLSSFKFQSKLSTWIGQIAYNSCLSYLEKKKLIFPDNIYGDETDDALELISARSINSSTNYSETLLFQKQLSGILKIEIEKLSPVYKTLITLYHNQELSYEEIAQITQLPEGTVKSYLFRARKALKENLLLQYKKEEL